MTQDQIRAAIDSLSESVRINGHESPTTDFLINFLADNVPLIEDLMASAAAADE
jgi:hypothetical protein